DPGLAGPGPVVDSSVLDSSVPDRNGAAVSVTIISTRAAGDRLRVSKVRIQLVPDIVPASQASSASRVDLCPSYGGANLGAAEVAFGGETQERRGLSEGFPDGMPGQLGLVRAVLGQLPLPSALGQGGKRGLA